MTDRKLLLTALILSCLVVFLLILGPVDQYTGEGGSDDLQASVTTGAAIGESDNLEPDEPQLRFALRYDKYLVPEPYTYEADGEERVFRFDNMLDAVMVADEATLSDVAIAYIDNYKNRNGKAPAYNGKSVDGFGSARSASAPAYYDESMDGDFRYLPDGTLVSVINTGENAVEIMLVCDTAEVSYFVPDKYVRTDDALVSLEKAIVVDRGQQNIASFEKFYDKWYVISYSLATTGKQGKYHAPTPLGYYYAIEKKDRFYYLKDGTTEVEGYAPYAVRFTAGAYIHGIATAYKYDAEGNRLDPGIHEFSESIGTIPLSHKCVRNYTSHAKFLYDWYEHGKTIVIVIE